VALRGRAEFQGLTDLRFSPDGRRLAVFANDASGRRLSLVTYPGGDVRAVPWTPPEFALTCAWHPDNRHVVVGGPFEVPGQLWLVDTLDGKAWPLTAGPGAARFGATVSPDGLRLAFSTVTEDQDLVEVRFDGPVIRPLLATALKEYDPTWAPDGSRLALVSTRGGAPEIWLRSAQEGWDRPLISVADFDRRALFLGTPSFSPDGRWIAFSAAMSLGEESIWVSSSNGGPAVELAEGKALGSLPTWSPDSRWIAYAEKFVIGKSWLLRKAAVGGAEPPQEIAELSTQEDHAPQWSPSGDWIAYLAPGGLALVSPDGRQQRVLLPGGSLNPFGWSRDGRTLYGLRLDQDHHSLLVAVDVASSRARTLGDLGPAERYSGFSLSPDGNGFATAVKRAPGDIWILEMPSSRPDATTPHS
jgi:dipeptidyl aminopeptidase/acylaminoacyl peptidase